MLPNFDPQPPSRALTPNRTEPPDHQVEILVGDMRTPGPGRCVTGRSGPGPIVDYRFRHPGHGDGLWPPVARHLRCRREAKPTVPG
ncbi:hypothetical protein TIFTF001_048229 [Ficus carica]|uniref:Uncharacterized protein n=1 Tax=Ficus carica TaxID=3494 RepID=A0AA87Z9N2_FICCA|nr:hypothetical protein TIFTF001_048205 [Ficus carica]GMN32830.1 hypothetical protein TIFTF001_048207 [Ficus carica]GMN32890.1 hypothetical protein TIFTF001_048219 [Ficus carica]GMN32909.1 hypothetical protein TIFTF001_048229 [Ficus carica]